MYKVCRRTDLSTDSCVTRQLHQPSVASIISCINRQLNLPTVESIVSCINHRLNNRRVHNFWLQEKIPARSDRLRRSRSTRSAWPAYARGELEASCSRAREGELEAVNKKLT